MKICLVSTFPPSRGGLSEYGFHIARELQQDPLISLTVLADRLDTPQPELEEFSVVRCWSFGDLGSSASIARAIRELKPDVVWFNLLFTTFGHNPVVAFAGLATPLLTRLGGTYTHVTLHHLMDVVDLKDAGVRWPRLYRAAGALATKMLLMANSMSVLMPAYRDILRRKYRGKNVHVRVHGILSRTPELPAFSLRGAPEHRILAFGKWGTYKRIEPTIDAFRHVIQQVPNARLVIAGGDHPKAKGYVASVAKQFADVPNVHFTGYVPESDVPQLFRSATVVLMPYASSTGASGVAHIACAYGVPMISANLPGLSRDGGRRRVGHSVLSACETLGTGRLAGRFVEVSGRPAGHGDAELLGRLAHDHAPGRLRLSAALPLRPPDPRTQPRHTSTPVARLVGIQQLAVAVYRAKLGCVFVSSALCQARRCGPAFNEW